MRFIITLLIAFYPAIHKWLGWEVSVVEAVWVLNLSVICMLNHVIYTIERKK